MQWYLNGIIMVEKKTNEKCPYVQKDVATTCIWEIKNKSQEEFDIRLWHQLLRSMSILLKKNKFWNLGKVFIFAYVEFKELRIEVEWIQEIEMQKHKSNSGVIGLYKNNQKLITSQ